MSIYNTRVKWASKQSNTTIFSLFWIFPTFLSRQSFLYCDRVSLLQQKTLSRHIFLCRDRVCSVVTKFSVATKFALLQQKTWSQQSFLYHDRVSLIQQKTFSDRVCSMRQITLLRQSFTIATENFVATEFSLLRYFSLSNLSGP